VCITQFYKAKHETMTSEGLLKGKKAVELEFMKWAKKGVIGHFREKCRKKVKLPAKNGIGTETKIVNAWKISIKSSKIQFEYNIN
jgi:hypothetical protein